MGERQVFALRLDAATLKRIATVQERYLPPNFRGGASQGSLPRISKADLVRWLLELGLDEAERVTGIKRKGGSR